MSRNSPWAQLDELIRKVERAADRFTSRAAEQVDQALEERKRRAYGRGR